MAKTIFGTTEKSNFILNLDLEKYRNACVKLMLIILWANAASEGINQMTYSVNGDLAELAAGGGFGTILGLLIITLRSVASIFSIGGVFALIFAVVGLMRQQWTKSTLIPYFAVLGGLVWAVISMFHSFDYNTSLFGLDGRDEGWFTLLMYAAMFYLGTMLRRKEQQSRLANGILIWGIMQCIWGLLQSLTGFASHYVMVEPLLLQNLKLPCGLTDSPVTFGMLTAVLAAVSASAALLAPEKKTRILALICCPFSVIMAFRTQTVSGLTAGIGAVILAAALFAAKRKQAGKKAWAVPAAAVCAACCGLVWVFFAPTLNGAYNTSNDQPLTNGFALYDGGIVWDDAYYRLGTCGPYSGYKEHDFDIYNSGSVLKHCQKEGLKAIAKYPVLGTGPDNFIFTQLHSSLQIEMNQNSIDRPYNDLLYIAATRGVLSLLLHLVTLGGCFAGFIKRRKDSESWMTIGAGGAVLLYTLASLTGISVMTVAPVFWMLLGMLGADPITDPVKPAAAKTEKKEKSVQKKDAKKK